MAWVVGELGDVRCGSIVVGLFSLGCVADLVGTPVCLRKLGQVK